VPLFGPFLLVDSVKHFDGRSFGTGLTRSESFKAFKSLINAMSLTVDAKDLLKLEQDVMRSSMEPLIKESENFIYL
jgi:hypothetical protein